MTSKTITIDENKLSNKIFDGLVLPRIPETEYEIKKRYWALAGDPATQLEFTLIPDQATLDAIKWEAETIYQVGSMEGLELVSDVLQIKFTDGLMLLKSLTYTDTPNLMDRMTGSIPSIKAQEGERKNEQNPLYSVGEHMMQLLPNRGGRY